MTSILHRLVDCMVDVIDATGPTHPASIATKDIVKNLDLSALDRPTPSGFDEAGRLDEPLTLMQCDPRADIRALGAAVAEARPYFPWIVDKATFYPAGSDLGDGYLDTNMNCQIIGPDNALAYAPDFRMGFFRFGPQVLYRDHAHLAPELYIPLTGPIDWRFDCGPFERFESGSLIFHEPHMAHAMMTGDVPFFAMFAWLCDVHEQIAVVPMDDWGALEAKLNR